MKKQLIIPDRSVYDNLKICVKEYGSLCALDYFGREISYRELIREVNRCACALVACGINRGDVVSVCLPNIPQAVYLLYAINKLGAVSDIIDPYIGENDIIARVEQSGSRYIFALDTIYEKIETLNSELNVSLLVTASVSDEMPIIMKTGHILKNFGIKKRRSLFMDWNSFISKASPSDRYISAHSTGNTIWAFISEGSDTVQYCKVSNKKFNDFAVYCLDMCGNIEKADRVLAVIPISQAFGICTCIHSVFSVGGTAVILPNFNNNDIDRAILRYLPNVIAGNSGMYRALCERKGFDGEDLSFINTAIMTGQFDDDLKKHVREQLSSNGSICEMCELKSLTEFVKAE
jgi:long-chain acyl-CoA synthetase